MTLSSLDRLETRHMTTTTRIKTVLFLANGRKIMSEIAEVCGRSTAAATGTIDALEKVGIVARSRPLPDRRTICVELTDRGRDALAEIQAA